MSVVSDGLTFRRDMLPQISNPIWRTEGFKMRRATLLLPMLLLLFPAASQAQNVDVGGGWAHVSGDNGVDGFNVAAYVWVSQRISLGGFFDDAWDNSTLGNFSLTPIGQIATKAHMENYMFGPRFFFSKKKLHHMEWVPFAEADFGGTHLHQQLIELLGRPALPRAGTRSLLSEWQRCAWAPQSTFERD